MIHYPQLLQVNVDQARAGDQRYDAPYCHRSISRVMALLPSLCERTGSAC